MVLLGITEGDGQEQCDFLADKLVHLRIFTDEQEKMNLSLQDINGGNADRFPVHSLRRLQGGAQALFCGGSPAGNCGPSV